MSMTIKDFDTTRENPFKITGIGTKILAPKERVETWSDVETGELRTVISNEGVVPRVHDSRKYVKIFTEALSQWNDLPVPAFKMLNYILSILEPKKDTILIDIKEALSFCNWKTRAMYYKGIIPLLEAKLLARKTGTGNVFFINPDVMFNGDRTDLYNEQ